MLFFIVWLMGVGCSRIRIHATAAWIAGLVCLFAVIAVYFRLVGSNDKLEEQSFVQDVIYSVAALLVLCSLQFPADLSRTALRWAKVAGESLAAFSFTLYVIHVPLLLMLKQLLEPAIGSARLSTDSPAHFALCCAILLVIIFLSWLFHLPFEAQTDRVRRAIKQSISARRATQARQNIA